MVSGEELKTERLADNKPPHSNRRLPATVWIGAGVTIIALVAASLKYSPHANAKPARATPASLPHVVVSRPLVENLDTRLSFLGQCSAVSQVEVRAQVGGTLTGIFFKDGDIVHERDLLFTIDPQPYEIALAQATAQLGVATAHLELAERQLARAKDLQGSDAGTAENVDQRTGDERAALASVEEAKARVRDARFDLDHCRIPAPFTGRIGKHLVSMGNLIGGSRTANGPTTLLATVVSIDPIYFDFDMSESDFLLYSKYRERMHGSQIQHAALAVGDDKGYTQKGTLRFPRQRPRPVERHHPRSCNGCESQVCAGAGRVRSCATGGRGSFANAPGAGCDCTAGSIPTCRPDSFCGWVGRTETGRRWRASRRFASDSVGAHGE